MPGRRAARPDERRRATTGRCSRIAGEHEAGHDRPRAPRRRRRSTRSTWTPTRASTRASARSTSSRSSRSATTTMDACHRPRARVRRADRRPLRRCRSTSTPGPRSRPDREKLADVRRGQYEGLKAEIDQRGREPDFGPPRLHPSAGAVAVGARPFLIAYNINLDSDDVDLARRIARRVRESGGGLPRAPGQRVRGPRARARPPAPRPGVDEPARLRRDAALAGLGRGPRPRRRGRRRARPSPSSSGSRRWPSFLAVADHAGAPRTTPIEARLRRRRGVPPAARLLARCRPSSCGSRPRAAAPARRRPATAPAVVSGGPFRVIEGGRTGEPTPGLLIVGAQEVVTLAGGRPARSRAGRGRPAAWPTTRPAPEAPAVAVLGGPDRRGRAARRGRGGAGRRTACRSPASPASTRPAGSVTPGLVDPHTHLLFAGLARGRARAAPAGRVLPRHPGRGRRDPLDGRRDPGRVRGGAARPRSALARRDARATGSRRSRRSPATGWTSRPSSGSSRSPIGSGARGRSTSCRRGWAPTPSRPSSGRDRTGTEAYVRSLLDEQLPGIAAHGRARFADVFCETGVFSAGPVAAGPRGGRAAFGLLPRLHADELAPSGGAELAAELGAASADHLATPSQAGIARAGRRGRGRRAGRRDAAAGHDLVPHEGPPRPGPRVHRRRRAGRDRHRLQPRAPRRRRTCRWRCRSPASTSGCRPDEVLAAVTINAARALRLEDEIGSIEAGKAADLVDLACARPRAQIPYSPGRGPRRAPSSSAAASSWTAPDASA